MDDIDEIARRVAHGHAYGKHVVERGEFRDDLRGPPVPIQNPDDFQQHVKNVLISRDTSCCTLFPGTADAADIFYHPPSNTTVIVPEKPEQEATALRSWRGINFFLNKCGEACFESKVEITFSKSIYELRPELAMAKEAQRIREADDKLRAAVEQRFAKEKEDMQQRHRRELQRSPDRERDGKRHAAELHALEKKKEEDFQRHCREREAARALREHQDKKERERQQRRPVEGPELGGGPRR